jgi:Zn-dependent metalloprotease
MRRSPHTGAPGFVPQAIVPPHVFKHLARLSEVHWPGLAARARESLQYAREVRAERCAMHRILPIRATPQADAQRTIYDAMHGTALPGIAVRNEGEPPIADLSVNEAYDALGATHHYFLKVHGRESIDGGGLPLDATVHYRRSFNNAFWNGRQMVFGDGDGEIFGSFTRSVDVIGHELTHGVTQYEAELEYEGQSGALNEHMSDVFGSLVKQYALRQTARKADWLIGAGLWAPGVQGIALRSMRAPGTAYDDPRVGRDPQPSHMDGYVETEDDNGGVHINSGIPNHAFYLAAIGFGGYGWVHVGKVWYLALTKSLRRDADFKTAARVTVDVAGRQYGTKGAAIVRAAWKLVGIEVRNPVRRKKSRRPTVAAGVGGMGHGADPRGAERGHRRAS